MPSKTPIGGMYTLVKFAMNKTGSWGEFSTQSTEEEYNKDVVRCSEYLNNDHLVEKIQAMANRAEEIARHLWMSGWEVVNFHRLPAWLKDNDLLLHGHRPQLNTVWACVKSVFRLHTETGNIWTHLLGFFGFAIILVFVLFQSDSLLQWQDKLVYSLFIFGAVCCLGFSCLFHTISCHSEHVAKIMNKLDYTGIAVLTVGSFVPYLYYAFYCIFWAKVFYLALIVALGTAAVIISMSSKFATPPYRPLRAGVFIALGLSGVIPSVHSTIINGFWPSVNYCSFGWLVLMGILYITGASIYSARVPERCFRGRFDLWLQSHQIFHVFVIAAAFVHYHGVIQISNYRLSEGDCRPSNDILTKENINIPPFILQFLDNNS
ncbi:Adiponectin receptor protein isoform 3 [Schistosoma japonicum]|uniref:Adiponectin receptor 2 n=2 Tax=Schistosoma japonicum TaxID=6182 RepID=C7TYL0_SCHJA|nr:Adiponectin receptor protein isoform 3 [Schistosoma japonicum]CAX82686.1 adiponectin receptor 2 [Schistosoma japonicum]